MTVAEYIALLQQFPPAMRCVKSECSEWVDARGPEALKLRENGGYWSSIYGHEDKIRMVDVVEIG